MSTNLSDIIENTKIGREYALLGNYESSLVYYQGVLQQINSLLVSLSDGTRIHLWQEVCNKLHSKLNQGDKTRC